jgi:hypothetical protein
MKVAPTCLVACALLLPVQAEAERAAVLPLRSEHTLGAAERAELTAAFEQALRACGVEPITGPDEPCADDACASSLIAESGARHAAELVLWHTPTGELSGLTVSIVLSSGERFSSGAQLAHPEDLPRTLSEATEAAYARMRRGPGPWLQLDGHPAGASITVDGQAAGLLPRQVKVSGGLHRVVVSHPGYEPFEGTITVPRNPDALKHVPVSLRPVTTDAPADLAGPRRSPWNYVVAGAAVAASGLLGIGPLRSAIEDGQCGRTEDGRCTGVVEFDTGLGVQLAAAGLLFASGVAFAIWAPITITGSSDRASVGVTSHF